jgi:septal ring factor EnvC (AmiA/AmiB activator)
MPTRAGRGLVLVALAVCWADLASAQSVTQRIRAQRDSLSRIRQERNELEARMRQLQGQAHSIEDEIANIRAREAATSRAVSALGTQLAEVTDELDATTIQLVTAQDELAVKRATLQRRLADIYRRGPLFSLEVMLSAESFGELMARYKYLHELASRDQALVQRVRQLTDQIGRQRRSLVQLQREVAENRDERAQEEATYRRLRGERIAALRSVERDATETAQRVAAIARDVGKLSDIITAMESERRRTASGPSTPTTTTGRGTTGRGTTGRTTTALRPGANLNWPVDGDLIYSFGRAAGPDRTVTRWSGIGIRAPAGTPVRSIAAGVVVLVDPHFGTYGATVMILHPSGEYSVYCSLGVITVAKDAIVDRGTQIGTVGVNDPRLQPHLHFEIRTGLREPIPVDPLPYLRPRR